MTIVRFAPSPTGYIHIGNTRIALFNWLYAQAQNGQFILRYDDTDIERSKQEYIDAIAEDLQWLGIKPDRIEYQSKRFDRYHEAVEKLKADGLLYPCYETPEELERRRKIRLSRKLPPVYGREALKLTDQEKTDLEAEGRKPHWRFLLPNFKDNPFETERHEVHWDDLVKGPQTVDLASMSDPVLIRADGTYLYTLPSVVDDIEMHVSTIIRGDDHVTNTGVQIAVFNALGATPPEFGHINLLTTASGEGLSKRKGDLSIRSLRDNGYEAMAVSSLATLIGTSENVTACLDMPSLLSHFSLQSVSKSAAKFDPAELDHLNRDLVHQLDYQAVKPRLDALNIKGDMAENFWAFIRGNIDKVMDAQDWWPIVQQDFVAQNDFDEQERDYLKTALETLPATPWDETTFSQWTAVLKEQTGRKGKALFHPLRLALTGRNWGPELAHLLPLIGRDAVVKRLSA